MGSTDEAWSGDISRHSASLLEITGVILCYYVSFITQTVFRPQSPEDSSTCEGGRGRDDDSEASSVCSERSLDSYRRHDVSNMVILYAIKINTLFSALSGKIRYQGRDKKWVMWIILGPNLSKKY